MRLKASPAALTEANARLRCEEWGRSRSPAGETAIPFLPTRELRAKLSKAHRRSERAAEIADGNIAVGDVSFRLAVRGRIAKAPPPDGGPPRPGQVLRFASGDFAAAVPAVAPFASKGRVQARFAAGRGNPLKGSGAARRHRLLSARRRPLRQRGLRASLAV